MVLMIIVNLKSYHTASGNRAQTIARAAKNAPIPVILAPHHYDLARCAKICTCYTQHTDPTPAERHTGYLPPQLAAHAGATGSLLNHSEHRISRADIEATKRLLDKANMHTIICARTPREADHYATLKPYAIALEPPELIAGDISISSARPEIIAKTVHTVRAKSRKVKILVGAGIKDRHDVQRSLELGAHGVLVASGIALATNPRRALTELIRGF